jgi:hypothetical protein
MSKIKNKIDLMENLDDLEKYQGKWKNHFFTKGVFWTGDFLHDSMDDAVKSKIKWTDEIRSEWGNQEFNLENGISGEIIIKCKLSDIVYLGAIPFKGHK